MIILTDQKAYPIKFPFKIRKDMKSFFTWFADLASYFA